MESYVCVRLRRKFKSLITAKYLRCKVLQDIKLRLLSPVLLDRELQTGLQ